MDESGTTRFSRNVAWTLGARLTIAGGSMLSGVIVARWLGAASVGTLASLTVLTVLALSFGSFGLTSATTYLVARNRHQLRSVMAVAVSFAFIAGVILALGIFVLTVIKPDVFGDIPTQLITIAVLAIPFQLLMQFSLAVFLGLGNIARYNLFDLFSQAFLVINPLVTLVLLGMGLLALVTLNAATAAFLSLVVLVILFRTAMAEGGNFRIDSTLAGEMFRYGLKFYVAMVSSVIIFRADLLIVNYFRGSSEAGVYAVSTQVGTLIMLLPNVISTVLFPRVTEAQDTSGEMTCRVTRHTAFIMLVVCLASIPAAFLLPVLYGAAFAAVPFQVLILLPGVYLLGIEIVQVQYFSSLGLPKVIPFFWVVTMLLFITLDLVFVPWFGAYGAAAVSSLAYSLMFVLVAIYFRSRTGRSYSESFLLSGDEFRGILKLHKTAIKTELG